MSTPSPECPICRGERQIRVPVYQSLTAEAFPGGVDIAPEICETHRIYPCPECAKPNSVAVQKLSVAKATGKIDDRSPVPLDYIRNSLARQLGQILMDKGFIHWTTRPGPRWETMMTIHEGTVAVAGGEQSERLDNVLKARQNDIVREVRSIVFDKVANWGSHYGQHTLAKDMVRLFVDEAITEVDRRYGGK